MNEQGPQYAAVLGVCSPALPGKKSKKWHWILGTVAVLGIISAVSGGGDEDPAAADQPSETVTETVTADPEPKAKEKAKEKATEEATEEAEHQARAQTRARSDERDLRSDSQGVRRQRSRCGRQVQGKDPPGDRHRRQGGHRVLDEEQYVIEINGGGDWDIWTVNCNDVSASVAARVKVDSQVTVIGTFDDGGDLGVELKDCTLA